MRAIHSLSGFCIGFGQLMAFSMVEYFPWNVVHFPSTFLIICIASSSCAIRTGVFGKGTFPSAKEGGGLVFNYARGA